MKITILGTGVVGQTVANRLLELGHFIAMGTRNPEETKQRNKPNQMTGESFSDWYKKHEGVELKSFNVCVQDADLVINATNGQVSLDVLEKAGEDTLAEKVLIDIANPLDFSQGMPPRLSVSNTDSLGEQIQNKFPKLKVVKSLNTMNAFIMMHPEIIPGDHNVFISGNDDGAKQQVKNLLIEIGWKQKNILDLGDITTARGVEMLLPLWVRLWGSFGHANFNFHIQQANSQ